MRELRLQRLEERDVPAAGISLQAGVLSIQGTAGDDRIFVNSVNGQVQATLNGATQSFDPAQVQTVVLIGDAGNDRIGNNTAIAGILLGDSGNDSIFGGAGNDFLDGGSGSDVLYDLPGVNTFVSTDGGFDRVFGNAASLILADAQDQQVRFFAAGRTPGFGSIQLEAGVLYLTPDNAGSVTILTQAGGTVNVLTTYAGFQSFDATQISVVAYFGGRGDDAFNNLTMLDSVAYGGLGGNDVLVGGWGYNLLKGGNGNDVLIGLGRDNELMGDGGADTLVGNQNTFFRSDNLDVVILQAMNSM